MTPVARRPRRQTRKKKAPSRGFRIALIGLALVVALGSGALSWLNGEAGGIWLAERGVESAQRRSAELWERTVLDALGELGIPADSIIVRPGRTTTVDVGSTVELRELNLHLTEELDAVGAWVHRGERWEKEGSSVLELRLGGENYLTHRVLARRGPQAAELEPPPPPAGLLAIVIDDWGFQLDEVARGLLDLPASITVAILPGRPYSLRALNEAERAGKEAILHMPMQPVEGSSPGPGALALTVGMEEEELRGVIQLALDGLPGVVGLNNHMGSELTQHRREMDLVMEVLDERGLYFLDSVTSPRSVAYTAGRERGIPTLKNHGFLDLDIEDPDLIQARLEALVDRARRRGTAVGIGHLTPGILEALRRVLPQLDPQDVKPVFLSEILRQQLPG